MASSILRNRFEASGHARMTSLIDFVPNASFAWKTSKTYHGIYAGTKGRSRVDCPPVVSLLNLSLFLQYKPKTYVSNSQGCLGPEFIYEYPNDRLIFCLPYKCMVDVGADSRSWRYDVKISRCWTYPKYPSYFNNFFVGCRYLSLKGKNQGDWMTVNDSLFFNRDSIGVQFMSWSERVWSLKGLTCM